MRRKGRRVLGRGREGEVEGLGPGVGVGCQEREGGSVRRRCGRRRGEQGVELRDEGCVAGVRGAEGEVQFAGLLEFAPEEEDGFGGWGGLWDWELDVLSN